MKLKLTICALAVVMLSSMTGCYFSPPPLDGTARLTPPVPYYGQTLVFDEFSDKLKVCVNYTGDNPASALEKNLKEMYPNYTRLFGQQALDKLDASLEAGKPVIVNVGKESIFTEAGHFIVIAGKTEDGKYIVNDPNIESYLNPNLVDGFMNGFTREQIEQGLNHIYFF